MINIPHSRNPYTYNYGLRMYAEDEPIYNAQGTRNQQMYTFSPGWELYPVGRQEIMPPEVDINLVDVPGSDYPLDITDVLTGRPQYGTRYGRFEFKILSDRSKWDSIYSSVMRVMHGKRFKIVRQEEPNYYYVGRLKVTSTKSDKYNGRVKITRTFEPYKRDVLSSVDDWLWDDFSFEEGIIYNPSNTYWNDPDAATGDYDAPECLADIEIAANDTRSITFPALRMPVTPIFHVTGDSDVELTMAVYRGGDLIDTYTLHNGDNRIVGFYLDEDDMFRLDLSHNKSTAQSLDIIFRGGSL